MDSDKAENRFGALDGSEPEFLTFAENWESLWCCWRCQVDAACTVLVSEKRQCAVSPALKSALRLHVHAGL